MGTFVENRNGITVRDVVKVVTERFGRPLVDWRYISFVAVSTLFPTPGEVEAGEIPIPVLDATLNLNLEMRLIGGRQWGRYVS